MSPRLLPALLLLAVPLCAQERPNVRPTPPVKQLPPNPDVDVSGEGDAAKAADGKLQGEKGEKGEVPAGPPPPRNAKGQCHFITSLIPKRLMPGQSGTLMVFMVLENDAVLLAPAPVTFQIQADQGPVHLSQPQFHPAKIASSTLAPAFQGRAAYDNTAIFEVPVSIASTAQIGQKQQIGIGLEFDLHQGRTGQSLGHFVDQANGEVEIGLPVQSAANTNGGVPTSPGDKAGSGVASQEPPAVASDPARAKGTGPATDAPMQGNLVAANDPVVQRPVPESDASADSESHPASSQDSSLVWLAAAGGLLVLALAAVIFSRKR